jgi:hypothetical protein
MKYLLKTISYLSLPFLYEALIYNFLQYENLAPIAWDLDFFKNLFLLLWVIMGVVFILQNEYIKNRLFKK